MSVSAEEFQSRYAGYCRTCEATGLTPQPGKHELRLQHCPQCFERGECPRCREALRHASFCAACNWEIDDGHLAHPSAALFTRSRLEKLTGNVPLDYPRERRHSPRATADTAGLLSSQKSSQPRLRG